MCQTWQKKMHLLFVCCSHYLHIKICFRGKLLDWIKFTQNNAKWAKSATRASEFRAQGNEKFRKCDNAGSLTLYTESVIHAPRDGEELPLALANRSAALLHLDAYQVLQSLPILLF